jgi:hypothetical protein
MDNARAQVAADGREQAESMQQGVDDGTGMHAGTGVNDHASRFVDRDNAGVLIEDRERNVFGRGLQGREVSRFDVDLFRAPEDRGRFAGDTVHAYAGVANPGL